MRVKIFDESHEQDLESKVNEFLKKLTPEQLIDLQYQVAVLYDEREQIYCFSCLIFYHESKLTLDSGAKKFF
ncbi:MAG: sporulation protein Cse60 [Bacilli bacterium]|jgi:hypothetical protein|nr:sporulation protein Cse60 [Bacilli bacterium]HHU24208.1 sporulation protein Cse60 [Acholeplasmataceae bacterium]